MKNKILYIALVVLLMASCKKDSDPILDDPDTRLTAELAANQAKLIAAPNGWKATIYPSGGKGFSFYFKFLADGKVDMMGDVNNASSTAPQTSTYRLKALQRPTLIFDTYNYIHLIADPDASISGGANASGLKSDFEFAFAGVAGDTLKFEGTFYGNKMSIVTLSAAESQSILAGGLKTMTDANTAYIAANKNPYLQFADGTKGALSIDPTSKTLKLTYLDSKGVVQSKSVTFAYGINKLSLSAYLNYGSVYFNELFYDSASKTYYIMVGTTRINVQNSNVPIVPLSLQFGFPSAFAYRSINIGTSLPLGVTSGFNAIYQASVTKFATTLTPSRTLVAVRFALTSNNTATVTTQNNNGTTTLTAVATYNYTMNDGVITLSNPIYDSNWVARTTQLIDIQNYFLTGPFKIDWVSSTNVNSPLLGGLYRTADLSSFMYGTL
ncbi:hypothetical protein CA265_17750 [Sphingobacteriaceae bacterium GW460-11-11-14-LB5]|nr:hypothetical protein CA265_17750 [Sphingobacteriaceae bacterium GW460-11-11-14-LB5]